MAEIVNVVADDSILDAAGNVDAAKLNAISYAPSTNAYLKLGEKTGQAFSDGEKLS